MKISSLILPVAVVLSTPAAAHECRPKAEAERNAADNGIPQLVAVTPEQWRWMEGAWTSLPETPVDLPAGTGAVVGIHPIERWSVWFFVDGDMYCDRIMASPQMTGVLLRVGAGTIVHGGVDQ